MIYILNLLIVCNYEVKHPRIEIPMDVSNCSINIGVQDDGYGVGGDEFNAMEEMMLII